MKAIITDKAPAAIGPYSQGVRSLFSQQGQMIFFFFFLPIDPENGEFKEGCIRCKARQSLTNIKHILEAGGFTMKDVVKVTIYLTDINDFSAVNEVYGDFFEEPYPARSAFAVSALPKNAPIEIEAIAVKEVSDK